MMFDFSQYTNNSKGFREFCINSLQNSFKIYKIRLENIIQEYSEPNVHDFRVSSRRFIAVLNMIDHFFPSPYNRRIRKSAKKHLSSLSRLRDIQVITGFIRTLKIQFPVLFQFLNYLNNIEFQLINSNKEYFKQIKVYEIEGDVFHLIRTLKYEFLSTEYNFDDLKSYILLEYRLLLEQKERVNIDDTDTIHKLRIKNKKFRYLVETTRPIFKNAKKICKILSTQQNKMGAIQDMSTLIKEINAFISENPHLSNEFQPVIEYLLNHQKFLISDFDKSSLILKNLTYFGLNED